MLVRSLTHAHDSRTCVRPLHTRNTTRSYRLSAGAAHHQCSWQETVVEWSRSSVCSRKWPPVVVVAAVVVVVVVVAIRSSRRVVDGLLLGLASLSGNGGVTATAIQHRITTTLSHYNNGSSHLHNLFLAAAAAAACIIISSVLLLYTRTISIQLNARLASSLSSRKQIHHIQHNHNDNQLAGQRQQKPRNVHGIDR